VIELVENHLVRGPPLLWRRTVLRAPFLRADSHPTMLIGRPDGSAECGECVGGLKAEDHEVCMKWGQEWERDHIEDHELEDVSWWFWYLLCGPERGYQRWYVYARCLPYHSRAVRVGDPTTLRVQAEANLPVVVRE
jgi:hypothetical protein